MKSRDNFRKNYYFISNPREKNSTTGYACVKINDIVKYDKNFIYQYYDVDSTLHNIMVGRKYIAENLKPCIKYVEDSTTGNIRRTVPCYLINLDIVFKYGKHI